MRILLAGGGSGGPVTPLLAVAEKIKIEHPRAEFLLVGTNTGPEKFMAENAKIPFQAISAGKLRRYFSWKNFTSPFFSLRGFFQVYAILKQFKPDCIFGAGSFVQVPVVWAGWMLKVPIVLHQQDAYPSLANRICQVFAKKITVTFESSISDFPSSTGIFYKKNKNEKVILTGNPFRDELKLGSKEKAIKEFNLKADLPTLLVLGGGTGSEFFNKLLVACLPEITKTFQVIHSTGRKKTVKYQAENYHQFEFIAGMANAYAAADVVLARAGLSTITELSNLRKLSIIVPMPDTHQELNASLLYRLEAAIILDQKRIKNESFIALLRKLLFAHQFQEVLKNNISKIMPSDASEKIAEIVIKTANAK